MEFTSQDVAALERLLLWRRDCRHFDTRPIADDTWRALQAAFQLAPSVGNSRPWRIVRVRSEAARAAIITNFESANAAAGAKYPDEQTRTDYAALKLAGLREAPEHLAIFTDPEPTAGRGLGRQSMPEMLAYSTVAAVHTLWLVARAHNVGVGWVSILDPDSVASTLNVPAAWALTAYLCLGYETAAHTTPELERVGWQASEDAPWLER